LVTLLLLATSEAGAESTGGSLAFQQTAAVCDHPTSVPLTATTDGELGPAPGVATARGAEATTSVIGPVVSLVETGSRAQVELEQPLFYTQWIVNDIDLVDRLRVDATLSNAAVDLEPSGITGQLRVREGTTGPGLSTEGAFRLGSAPRARIDIPGPVDNVLFSNGGSTELDLALATGCAAFHAETSIMSTPTWDADSERFIARYAVMFQNNLPNAPALVAAGFEGSVGPTAHHIEQLGLALDVSSPGFGSAEVVDLVLPSVFRRWLNPDFDGVTNVDLLSEHRLLVWNSPLTIEVEVAYVPDFDDPVWAEGVDAPAPTLFLDGQAAGTPVSARVGLRDGLIDETADGFATPAPVLQIDHDQLDEPAVRPDGTITVADRFVLTNAGELGIDDITLAWDLDDMYGEGTRVVDSSVLATGACADAANSRFDGVGDPLLLTPHSFQIGASCEVVVRMSILPGDLPSPDGTTYQTTVVAEGRSGIRAFSAISAISERFTQLAELQVDASDLQVVNRLDGSYEISGDVTVSNAGDQNLEQVGARLAIHSLNAEGEPEERSVTVERLHAVGRNCEASEPPTRSSSDVRVMPAQIGLSPSNRCVIEFTVSVRPGSALEGWTATATVTAVSPVGTELTSTALTPEADLPEALGLAVTVQTTEPENQGDGTYILNVETNVQNTSDVPLNSVVVDDATAGRFGSRLVSSRIRTNTCDWIDVGRPLLSSTGPEGSCQVINEVVVRPGSLLVDWSVGAAATATSVSGRDVSGGASSELFTFVESPSLATALSIAEVERGDDGSFAVVLDGTVENRGDIQLAAIAVSADLQAAFGDVEWVLDWTAANALTINPEFDGRTDQQLLTTADRLDVGEQRTFRMHVTVRPGAESGPYVFTQQASALSPSLASVGAIAAPVDQTLPMLRVVERRLDHVNNGDGTFDIMHLVRVRNAGAGVLDDIRLSTDFEREFRGVLLGEPTLTNGCSDILVGPAESCSLVTTATIRPWSDLGPYDVTHFVNGFDTSDVAALVLPEIAPVNAAARLSESLRIFEQPALITEVVRSDVTNNGDGTYGLRYRVETTNDGDVPLYSVGVSNGVRDAFGGTIVADQLAGDSCAAVSFGSPLSPGQACVTEHDVIIRPGADLGPWDAAFSVSADAPSGQVVASTATAEPVAFAESVALAVDTNLRLSRNNGDGTYNLLHVVEVENTSDVPLVSVTVNDGPADAFGDVVIDRDTLLHSCAWVDSRQPLAPGAICEVQTDLRVQPGTALGPWIVDTEIAATSPSGESVGVETATTELTLTEAPDITLATEVTSVENNGDGSFRIVVDLAIANEGDVRVDELGLDLDLADAFDETTWGIAGLISRDFTVNEEFPLGESTSLLANTPSLRIDNGGTITLVLTLNPGDVVGPFTTDLLATGVTPAGVAVESAIEATVDLPAIAATVVDQTTENNGDGSYTVETTYRILNSGTTPLNSVRLTEDLAETYQTASAQAIEIRSTDIPVAEPDDRFRGIDLLAPDSSLAVGEAVDVVSVVQVTPGNALGPFEPSARASAVSPTRTFVAEQAVAPDVVVFVEQPALRVDQRLLSRPVWNQSGRFDVSFAIDVINDGDVELRSLQIRQDLLNALGWGSSIIVRDVRSELLTPNRDFDGLGVAPLEPGTVIDEDAEPVDDFGDTRLLAGWDTLAAQSTATIILDLTITPETRGIYSTRVVSSALSPAGTGLGSDGDLIEATTLTRLTVQGELGVAKQVLGDPRVRADGSVDVTYEIYVENAGPFPLTEVEVHDQLSQAFGIGATFVTSRVRADADSPCVGLTSSSFDGGTIDPVLVSRVELRPGESCRLQYDAIVTPSKAFPGPFRSSAFALGSDPFAGTVIDDSTDGTDPDPDGNQEPGDNDLATAVRVELPEPAVEVSLATTSVQEASADGWFDIVYEIELTNTGLIDVRSTRLVADLDDQWPVSFVVESVTSDELRTNTTFDGDGDIRLLSTQNVLRAGRSAIVTVEVRTRRPRNDQLTTIVDFDTVSVVGGTASAQSSTSTDESSPAVTTFPNSRSVSSEAWWETLTDEEKQMFMLGGFAFAIIFVAGVINVRRRWLRFTKHRAERRAARKARDEDVVIDLRDDVIDLRDQPEPASKRTPRRGRRASQESGTRRGRRAEKKRTRS
jgi:hypothetical protein